jgi:hypothetical protein
MIIMMLTVSHPDIASYSFIIAWSLTTLLLPPPGHYRLIPLTLVVVFESYAVTIWGGVSLYVPHCGKDTKHELSSINILSVPFLRTYTSKWFLWVTWCIPVLIWREWMPVLPSWLPHIYIPINNPQRVWLAPPGISLSSLGSQFTRPQMNLCFYVSPGVSCSRLSGSLLPAFRQA